MRDCVRLLGNTIDKVDLHTVGERICAFVQAASPHQIVTANVDFLRLGREDPHFRDLVNTADLVVADGMPLVWASRIRKDRLPQRITGVDLLLECSRLAINHDYSIFLLGAGPGVAEEASAVLAARYPGLRIAGTLAPRLMPGPPSEEERTIRFVQECKPDILFVALGAPRQELWIRTHMHRLGVPVCIGVGGSFDMLAGRVLRAPSWMQRFGLEWLFRLFQEPRRLWKRYIVHDLPIFARLMLEPRARRPIGRDMFANPVPQFDKGQRTSVDIAPVSEIDARTA